MGDQNLAPPAPNSALRRRFQKNLCLVLTHLCAHRCVLGEDCDPESSQLHPVAPIWVGKVEAPHGKEDFETESTWDTVGLYGG